MNIVHVIRQFYPAVGGMESVARELAAAQVAAGHHVRVVTLNRTLKAAQDNVLAAREIVDGAEVFRVPFFGSSRYPLAPSAIKFIRDADVVHVHAIDFFFDYLAWTKPLHRKKLVVSTHGGFFHTRFAARLKRLYFFTVTRLSLTFYDGVVAVSGADLELFSRLRRRGIVCIENGVDVSKYADASPTVPIKAVLALGRLSSNKRLDQLIAFFAALHRRDPQWKLTIAGRMWDIDAGYVTTIAETQHVRDAVEIIVGPNDEKIRQLMGRCSVIASASEYEGFGVAAVEGMSAGLFPVLSDIPTFRSLVSRTGAGILIDFSDAEAAANAFIAKWREIEADYLRYRRNSIDAASEFDWKQVAQAYAELYEYVCGTKTRTILGVPVRVGSASQMVELLDARFERADPTIVAFANAHALNVASSNERVRTILQEAVVLNDGIGMDIASLMLFRSAFPQNLNGTDFIPHYLQNTRHRYRIFLFGGKEGIAEQAGEYFSKFCPQHRIVGYHHGYFAIDDSSKVVAAIRASGADVILVAMGNPQQELWLADNLKATGSQLGFGVGALFDFVSGHLPRAPVWVRTARLEWLYRLVHEPGRLTPRYLVGIPVFLFRIFNQWLSGTPIRLTRSVRHS